MSEFLLSPGITPELTDVFVVAVPLAIGFGYLLAGRKGFALAVSVAAVVLGGIKLYTDFRDLPDDAVSLAAMIGGAMWALRANGILHDGRGARLAETILGPVFVLVGLIKLRDFYDPFDLLLADATILAGAAIWLYARRPLIPPSRSDPAIGDSAGATDPGPPTLPT